VFEVGRADVIELRARGGDVRPAPPQTQPSRPPTPVYATAQARLVASTLMPGRVLEVEVERAIRSGGLGGDPHATPITVRLDGGLLAFVRGKRSPATGRKSYLVTGLKAAAS
jgi:hypothetical protein